MHLSSLLFAGLVGWSTAAPVTHAVHEKRLDQPSVWKKAARVDGSSIVPVRVGLTQKNLENGYEHVMDVSHPDSPNYGKHWTADQVHDMFAPSSEAVESVKAWLVSSGFASDRIIHSENKGWLAFDASVAEMEKLLHTEYFEHEYEAEGSIKVGCDQYHLPKTIQSHVDYITPGVSLSARMKKRSVGHRPPFLSPGGPIKVPFNSSTSPNGPVSHYASAGPKNCGVTVTPDCIRAMYSVPVATRKTAGHSMGIYEQRDTYAQGDLNLFYAAYSTKIPKGTGPIKNLIDGAVAPVAQNSPLNGGESDVDINLALSLIYPQSVTLYQVEDPVQAGTRSGWLNNFLDALDGSYCTYKSNGISGNTDGIDPSYPDSAPGGWKGKLMCGKYTPAKVISVSYGEAEADLPVNYLQRQCNEFMKLGLQGHTILFSSGDYGVAGYPGDVSATGCMGKTGRVFNPGNPIGCPYVTSVGATQLSSNQQYTDAESAMYLNRNFSSGGGFSNIYSAPDYQKAAVANYFATAKPTYKYYTGYANIDKNGGRYNRAGRGYPDVAANGANFPAFINGGQYHFYGTSLAAPLWGSIVTLLNQERAAKNKGPIGFINPVLYKHTNVLNDITKGNNPGCGTDGFHASKGWDPVTGLGTPNYPKMLQLFLSLA